MGLPSVFETSGPTLHLVFHQVCPHKRDYARIVVAVSEIVIERGKAMLLAGLLHAGQLARLKFVLIDIYPILI